MSRRAVVAAALGVAMLLLLVAFAIWSANLTRDVADRRDRLAARVGWLDDLQELEAAQLTSDAPALAAARVPIARDLPALHEALPDLQDAVSRLAGPEATVHDVLAVEASLRSQNVAIAADLGRAQRELDQFVLIALVVATSHAVSLAVALRAWTRADGQRAALAAELDRRLTAEMSRQRRAEAQLRVADRLASIGTLAAGVAHEINNPLTWMLANLATAEENLRDGDTRGVHARLRDVRDGADRLREITRDISGFARGGADDDGPTSLREALSAATRISHPGVRHRARVDIDVAPDLWVRGGATRLGQVFLNLLVNAAQAMPADGRPHRIAVSATASAEAVDVVVADDGAGIPPEAMYRLFDPFFTTKPPGEGTGLGLFVCHQIVTGLGGAITVESEPGKGTRVTVRLPRAAAPAAPVPTEAPEPTAPLRVLVVDDEELVARALARILHPHDVTVALSVAEARPLCIMREFDVVLCDLDLPEEPGRALLEYLRAVRPELAGRVRYMTGGVASEADRDFLAGLPAPPLGKPFDAAELRRALAEAGRPNGGA